MKEESDINVELRVCLKCTIGVLSLEGNLLASKLDASSSVSATSLSVEGLTSVAAKPVGQGFP